MTQQVIKEKLGGALFSDHHQMQLLVQQQQLRHGADRVTQTTVADYARKAYLYGVRDGWGLWSLRFGSAEIILLEDCS